MTTTFPFDTQSDNVNWYKTILATNGLKGSFTDKPYNIVATKIAGDGYIGSRRCTYLTSTSSLELSPAHITSTMINIVAKDRLEIGTRYDKAPTRFYTPKGLCFKTKHLVVRNMAFVKQLPEAVMIICQRLTLIRPKDQKVPLHLEKFKSWVNPQTRIDIITQP